MKRKVKYILVFTETCFGGLLLENNKKSIYEILHIKGIFFKIYMSLIFECLNYFITTHVVCIA